MHYDNPLRIGWYDYSVGDRMFLGMQDFAQIQSNLPKFRFNFAKFNQIFPNLINFAQKSFATGYDCIPCIPSSFGTEYD